MHASRIAYCFAALIAGSLFGLQASLASAAGTNANRSADPNSNPNSTLNSNRAATPGAGAGTANASAGQPGQFPAVARYMWRRYFNRDTTCPTYSGASAAYNAAAAKLPLTECLGVIMRFTSLSSEPNGGWIPEPKSVCGDPDAAVSCGGVSAIFLRTDSKFNTKLWGNDSHGFTLYPNQGKYAMPAGKTPVPVICAYPYDAGTDGRAIKGCGPWGAVDGAVDNLKDNPNWCDPPSAASWRPTYTQRGPGGQCAFDLTGQSGSDPAQSFRESLKGIAPSLMGHSLDNQKWQENELRLATWGTDPRSSAALPIESFFYLSGTPDGLAGAQDDQQKYYALTGQFVPVVEITQPTALTDDFQFHYHSANQKVPVPASALTRLPCTPGDFDPANWKVDNGECSLGTRGTPR